VAEHEPVTRWVAQLKAGEQEAARLLWERYFRRLLGLVRRRLPDHLRRDFDEEDVVVSAFRSFFAGVAAERFPRLDDDDNFWAILSLLAARKATAYLRRRGRLKRGGGLVQGESALGRPADGGGLDALLGAAPDPELEALFAEQCEALFEGLGDDDLRQVALLKLHGHTVAEIAERTGHTQRRVQRRLEIIRRSWRDALPGAGPDDEEAPAEGEP
jgi:RNA polymerase sigma factor (sigma-70 family)